jgi:hypothetical protein
MGKIIWLASYPKSGNTWLRIFLTNLLSDAQTPYDINKLGRITGGDSGMHWYNEFDPRPAGQISKSEIAALRPRVHELITRSFSQAALIKTHNALVSDRGTPMITLQLSAGAVYIVRNPLDVVVSYANHNGSTFDNAIEMLNTTGYQTENLPDNCYEVRGSWSQHVKSWTLKPSWPLHVVRYEDMLGRPGETFATVSGFLGINASRELIDRAIRNSSFDVLQEQERSRGFAERSNKTERFFRVGKTGQWRRLLTSVQVEAVTSAHGEQMARFGYWPLPADA